MSARLLAATINEQIDGKVVFVRRIDEKDDRRLQSLDLVQIHQPHRIRSRRINVQFFDVGLTVQQVGKLLDDGSE